MLEGKVLCYRCDSTSRFANKCPHAFVNKENSTNGQVHITLNTKPDVEMTSLIHESFGMAILDCGCTKTVCGGAWMNDYLDLLNEEDKTVIEVKKC